MNRTYLDQVDLWWAILEGASLVRAKLEKVDLRNANLVNANLKNCMIIDTNMDNADKTGMETSPYYDLPSAIERLKRGFLK